LHKQVIYLFTRTSPKMFFPKSQKMCQGPEDLLHCALAFALHVPALWAIDAGELRLYSSRYKVTLNFFSWQIAQVIARDQPTYADMLTSPAPICMAGLW
jgi:hypothetical protein